MDTSEVYVLREVALYSRQWSGAMMALGYIQLIEPSRLIIAAGVTKNRKNPVSRVLLRECTYEPHALKLR